jgi:hypothetical protein
MEKTEQNQKRIAIADVFGTSMDPLLTDNSEVPIVEMPEGTTYEIDDLIMFRSGGFNVIHRVEYIFTYNGETYYVTEGINNKFVDDAVISGDQIIGKADFSKETFKAAQELAKQNKLHRYTVHALTENQKNIKSKLENGVSDLLNGGMEIHKIAHKMYSEPNPNNNLIKKILKDQKTGKTKLSKLRNLMLAIDGISDIEGISEDKLELIKQDLLDICFSKLMKNKGRITYNDIKTLNLPPNFDTRLDNYKKHFVYYHEFEKEFIKAYKGGERLYQTKWLTPGAIKGQREILWQLSGGKDFYTGENYIDLYKEKMLREGLKTQEELESMSYEQLKKASMEFTERHHLSTDLDHIQRTTDSRVSAIVLIWEDTHKEIKRQMDSDGRLKVFYANQFREIYEKLLQGEAPGIWEKIYQYEFNKNNRDNKNIIGIKFLFFQEYL